MALTDDLFEAVDTIVSAKIANLPYDQTIECEIISILDDIQQKYLVKYQEAKFEAYSTNTEYTVGDIVYVNIPKGDFTENKFIINKKQGTEAKKVTSLPFLKMLKGSNLLESIADQEYAIETNSYMQDFLQVGEEITDPNVLCGNYTKLGIKASFYSNIIDDMASGEYGLHIILNGFDQNNTPQSYNNAPIITKEYYLKFSDMVGANLYNTVGYCNQEKVIDIDNFIIKSIKIYLWQDKQFITQMGFPLSKKLIYVSNLQLYLGYDINDYPDQDQIYAIIYTNDGLIYNENVLQKNIYLKFIQHNKFNDNLEYSNVDQIFLNESEKRNYSFIWERYNIYTNVTKEENNSHLDYYEPDTELTNINLESGVPIQVALPAARNRMYSGYVFILKGLSSLSSYRIMSNELFFKNGLFLPSSEIVDLVLGLTASAYESDNEADYNGKYFIYGQDNKAIDTIAVAKVHYIYLRYTSISEESDQTGFQIGDVITWKIPINNSMILPEYVQNTPLVTNDDQTMYIFSHIINNTDILTKDNFYKIPYFISNYYTPTATNNTIEINMTRGMNSFNTKIELLFGNSGSQGSEYFIRINLIQNNKIIYTVPLDDCKDIYANVEVYDYDNKKISLKNFTITWSFLQNNSNGANSNMSLENDSDNPSLVHIVFNDSKRKVMYHAWYPSILKIEVTKDNIDLVSYLPIPVCQGTTKINANGNTLLIYDITGKKPFFTKTAFKLDTNTSVRWEIVRPLGADKNFAWAPILVNGNELAGPSIYMQESSAFPYYVLVALKSSSSLSNYGENDYIWASPIYMFQHKYPNATEYNEFNQSLITNTMDGQQEYKEYIEKTLAGRISSGNFNSLNGIFLGDLKTTIGNRSMTKLGLYAYHDGTKFVEINEDGYMFLDGSTDNETETGGINIKDANLYNCTLTDCNIDMPVNTTRVADNYNLASGNIKDAINSLQQQINELREQLNALQH